ncbi:MAG: hypothetical protein U0794_05405 [Isosphaeraceae bacterium]
MRLERGLIFWSAGGIASGVLAASVWAQSPMPYSGPTPMQATGPAPMPPVVAHEHGGPLKRAFRHTFRVLQDNMIGYPDEFAEPPLGAYVNEYRTVMRAKADPHRFTLYRSDFLEGTNRLSPSGASRFNIMATRLPSWPGPVTVEWSPDQPGLAESRKQTVLALLQRSGLPVIPERVVIGPSPYPGLFGTEAANNYNILINRDQQAPSSYSVSPNSAGTLTGGTP